MENWKIVYKLNQTLEPLNFDRHNSETQNSRHSQSLNSFEEYNKDKMGIEQRRREPPLSIKMISAGLAGCFAEAVTFPIDVAKVRLQVQGEGTTSAAKSFHYRGMFGTILTIAREEGPRALYSGLAPGLQRQVCFCTVRLGFYDTVRNNYVQLFGGDKDKPHVLQRILAGITTGGLAVISAQPTDVVKVRMQAQSSGVQRYNGCLQAYRHIAHHEGIRGLWKGLLPNVTRNAVVNAGELVSYDLIKLQILSSGLLSDHMPCHFLSAFGAGFFTTCLASPIDVVKTRFMNSSPGTYTGALNCAFRMYKEGGLTTFYKGFVPSFMRLGSWNIVMFVCFEQLKRGFMGLSYFKDQVGPVEQALKQKKLNVDTY